MAVNSSWQKLIDASRDGDLETVKYFLNLGVPPGINHDLPLRLASKNQHVDVAVALIKASVIYYNMCFRETSIISSLLRIKEYSSPENREDIQARFLVLLSKEMRNVVSIYEIMNYILCAEITENETGALKLVYKYIENGGIVSFDFNDLPGDIRVSYIVRMFDLGINPRSREDLLNALMAKIVDLL